MNPHHPTPTGASWAGGLQKENPFSNHLGHVTRYAYYTSGPLAGQVQTMTNPELETVTYSYDLQNRKVSESGTGTYPVTKIYNEEGQMTELHTFRTNLTRPDITRWHYDPASGLLEAKEYADHSTVRYTYDAAGRLASRTWARGVRTIYAYDPVSGDLKSISYSDGTPGVSFTSRDRLGRIDTLTDAVGAQNLDFAPEGSLTSHAYTDGALAGLALTIGKDGLGRRSGLSVTRNGNTIHSVAEGYDQFGRSSTHSFGGRTISYGYDPARGLRTQTQFPSGVTTTTTYDSAGRISSVLSAKNGQILAGRTYPVIDKANRRRQIGEPDGSLWTYDYNTRGEVIRGEKQDPAGNLLDGHRFTYQYDSIGSRTAATTGAPDLVAGYTANAVNQYTQVTTPQTTFVRGSAAGAATVTVKGQAVPLGTGGTFNARVATPGPAAIVATAADGSTSTETRTVALPPATFAPSYDADGNMLSDGLWTYTWDGENRLVALESTAANQLPQRVLKRFRYDFQSRRIAEERYLFDAAQGSGGAYVLEKAQRWIYDGWNQTLELLNDRTVRAYVWGLDLSGMTNGAGGIGGLLSSLDLLDRSTWDYLYDGNGNVIGLGDGGTGGVLGEYAYGPFGDEVAVSGNAGRLNRFRFSTKMVDSDSSLLNYGFRDYSPFMSRWVNRDPINEDGGVNVYAMTHNDLLGYIDILGQSEHPANVPWNKFPNLKQPKFGPFAGKGFWTPSFKWHYGPWQCRKDWVSSCQTKCKAKNQEFRGCVWVADLSYEVQINTIGGKLWGRVAFIHCCCDCPTLGKEEVEKRRRDYESARDKIRDEIERSGVPSPGKEPSPSGGVQNPPMHHMDPISRGGSPTDPNNLIPLPTPTHQETHTAYGECYKQPPNKYTNPGPDWPPGSR